MKTKQKSYWLVFFADNGSREDCSVYYSWLVRAASAEQAIARVIRDEGEGDFGAQQMTLLED